MAHIILRNADRPGIRWEHVCKESLPCVHKKCGALASPCYCMEYREYTYKAVPMCPMVAGNTYSVEE